MEYLQHREYFKELYFKFCELSLIGEGPGATIRQLHKLVKDEINRANRRVEEFNAARKHYENGGRHHLVTLMREKAEAGEYPT
jgi:hypothetical protein